jgi:hypothetical protein
VSPQASEESPRHVWFKFFPGDWQGDELLPLCSMAARGLLTELLCVMHKAVPYGHLVVNGKVPSDAELSRLVRTSPAELRRLRSELLDRGVLSRADDGTIFSRRMVRKGRQSAIGQETGKLGGNPRLRPLTGDVNHPPLRPPLTGGDNTQKLEARSQNPLPPTGVLCDEDRGDLARRFLEAYPVIYARCRSGSLIRMREARDFPTAVELVSDYPPLERLESMVELFLLRKDTGEMGKPGSVRQFQHYAPDCDRLLRENGR